MSVGVAPGRTPRKTRSRTGPLLRHRKSIGLRGRSFVPDLPQRVRPPPAKMPPDSPSSMRQRSLYPKRRPAPRPTFRPEVPENHNNLHRLPVPCGTCHSNRVPQQLAAPEETGAPALPLLFPIHGSSFRGGPPPPRWPSSIGRLLARVLFAWPRTSVIVDRCRSKVPQNAFLPGSPLPAACPSQSMAAAIAAPAPRVFVVRLPAAPRLPTSVHRRSIRAQVLLPCADARLSLRSCGTLPAARFRNPRHTLVGTKHLAATARRCAERAKIPRFSWPHVPIVAAFPRWNALRRSSSPECAPHCRHHGRNAGPSSPAAFRTHASRSATRRRQGQ